MQTLAESETEVVDYLDADEQLAERYFSLDHVVNQHDAEGQGPLRRGEEPFRWSFVEAEARALLDRTPDLRVAVWLLRALIAQKGLVGLDEGLGAISGILKLPAASILPRPEDGENARDAHVVPLGWLGGEAFLAVLRVTKAHPQAALRLCDALMSSGAADGLSSAQREEAATWLRTARAELIEIRERIINEGGSWERDPIIASEFISSVLPLLATGPKSSLPSSQDIHETGADPDDEVLPSAVSGIRVENRTDVKSVARLLLDYYKKNEPAHPASILLQRFQRTIDASFEEVLGELFADGASLIERVKNPAR